MNRQSALAVVLVDELVRCGVRHAVLCPGSRSAPLAYALEAADRAGLLRLHVRVDERSAAFLALGLAKVSRVPAVIVTTSGTAVANLHPAVLEASHADVPLIVLSADRPAELQGTGANQTTHQGGLFGSAPRWSATLTAPEDPAIQNAGWRSSVGRAWAASTGALGGRPGPVHLDVQLREPLVPEPGELEPGPFVVWPDDLPTGRPDGAPWTGALRLDSVPGRAQLPADHPGSVAGSTVTSDPARTVVLVGDLPEPDQAAQAVRWAVAQGWPVVSEPFGSADRAGLVPAGSVLLTDRGWVASQPPDRVITVGRLTLSRHVASLVRREGVRAESVSPHPDWTDPSHTVSVVHPWSSIAVGPEASGVGAAADPVTSPSPSSASSPTPTPPPTPTPSPPPTTSPPPTPTPTPPTSPWRAVWQAAGDRLVERLPEPAWPTGLAVAATVLRNLPAGAVLFAASSNAARDLDLAAVPPAAMAPGLRVVASRGLAGIDGCVATPIGLALAGTSPTFALVGDLAFVHDGNALAIGPGEPRPDLTVVVVNDEGGGIFSLLEPGDPQRTDLADRFTRIFTTPTGTDLGSLCRAHGVPHEVADSAQALADAVTSVPAGLRVVEVRVDPGNHRRAHEQLRRAAVAVLAE